MRVSDKMVYSQINDSINKSRTGLNDALSRASSQKRVNKPSDDPMSAARVLSYKTEDQNNTQFGKVLTHAKSYLEFSEQSLGELGDVFSRVKELVLGAVNDASTNPDTRRTLAREVKQLYEQTVQVGNRKLAGKFIFGGFSTVEAPFDYKGQYKGDDGEVRVPIDREAFVAVNMPGSRIFLGKDVANMDQPQTQAQPGTTLESEDPQNAEPGAAPANMRGPASVEPETKLTTSSPRGGPGPNPNKQGVNLFHLLRKVEVALEADDKLSLQMTIDELDDAHNQVTLMRSELGSRLMNLNSATESLGKVKVETKSSISQLEYEDAFKSVSDVNKNETTLKATLATSNKMMQPSLLDFLR